MKLKQTEIVILCYLKEFKVYWYYFLTLSIIHYFVLSANHIQNLRLPEVIPRGGNNFFPQGRGRVP